jgi:hypothetical protein
MAVLRILEVPINQEKTTKYKSYIYLLTISKYLGSALTHRAYFNAKGFEFIINSVTFIMFDHQINTVMTIQMAVNEHCL